jgi:hypothetical protein
MTVQNFTTERRNLLIRRQSTQRHGRCFFGPA